MLSLFAKNKRFFGATVNIKLDESRLFDQRSTKNLILVELSSCIIAKTMADIECQSYLNVTDSLIFQKNQLSSTVQSRFYLTDCIVKRFCNNKRLRYNTLNLATADKLFEQTPQWRFLTLVFLKVQRKGSEQERKFLTT